MTFNIAKGITKLPALTILIQGLRDHWRGQKGLYEEEKCRRSAGLREIDMEM
jgi:hypothetical protein